MSGGLVDSRPAHGIGCFRAFLMSFFRHRALAAVVRLFVKQLVLVNDFLWDELEWELHVFVPFHGGAVVKVFYIEHHKFGVRSGDGAVEETFGGGQACTLGGGQAWEVEFVTTHRDADTVRFGLGWSNGRNEASIGDLSAGRNGVSFNENDGVGTGGHPGANALGEAAEIVGQGRDPD